MSTRQPRRPAQLSGVEPLLEELPELLEEARQLARRRTVERLGEEMAEQLLQAARSELHASAPAAAHTTQTPPPDPTPTQAPPAEPLSSQPPPPPAPQEPTANADADADADADARADTAPGTDTTLGIYVYGVIHAASPLPDHLTGVHPDHRPGVIVKDDLAAVVSEVPMSDFGERELRQHLENLEWVERTARAHEAVVEAVATQTTLVPMRMCTIYRNRDGVLEMLAREQSALEHALEHLAGKSEWSVKLYSEPTAGEPPAGQEDRAAPADPTDPADPDSGTTYLQARLGERDAREQHRRALRQVASEVHEQICRVVTDAVISRPQPRELTGHPGEMLLNGAYLVEDEQLVHFTEMLGRLGDHYAEQGFELVITGPWPAYNFVSGTIGAAW